MKSEYISIKPYKFDCTIEDDGVDTNALREYVTYAFAKEFCIAYHNAEHIIKNLDLFSMLIDRYWEEFYEKWKENKNEMRI